MLRNSESRFGAVTIAVHWISALLVISQFATGLYMRSLDYYDPAYQVLPWYHKSMGILFAALLAFRIAWAWISPRPGRAPGVGPLAHRLALLNQKTMLALLVLVVACGYLISTADGRAIQVFGLFQVPATLTLERQEDWAGQLHYLFALAVITLAAIHALAALRHHFYDRGRLLMRMLGR